MAKKKQPSGLSPEAEAKAQAWITQQRETAEAWQQVEFVAGSQGKFSGADFFIVHLGRALLDLREKLAKHENKLAEDAHGCGAGCEASRAADAARAHALEDLEGR